jgi:hypothetical protein
MKTRVYAIKECENVHEISNQNFIYEAEKLGNVWSLTGFQNLLNCEGRASDLDLNGLKSMYLQSDFEEKIGRSSDENYDKRLHFRFIDIND